MVRAALVLALRPYGDGDGAGASRGWLADLVLYALNAERGELCEFPAPARVGMARPG
jgi:hypothetical protein